MILTHNNNDFERDNLISKTMTLFSLCLVLTMAYHYTRTNKEEEEHYYTNLLAFVFASLGGQFFISSITSPAFSNFFKALNPYLPERLTGDSDLAIYNRYKKYTDEMRASISEPNLKTLESLLKKLKNYTAIKNSILAPMIGNSTKEIAEILQYIITTLQVSQGKGLAMDTVQDRNLLFKKLDSILQNYPSEVSLAAKEKIIIPFLANALDNENKLPTAPVFLLGAPGVGKTWFVTELAKTLGIPLVKFNNGDIEVNKYESLIGDPEKIRTGSISIFTRAAHAAALKGHNSCIIFLDEFDKMVKPNQYSNNSGLFLEIFNNASFTVVTDSYLELQIDVSKMLVFVAGNKKLTEIDEELEPLSNRFVEIKFDKLEPENKRGILIQHATQMYANAKLTFTPADEEEIDAKIEADQEPGVRQLMLWMSGHVRTKQAEKNLLAETIWDKKVLKLG